MQLVKIIVMITVLLPSLAMANNCGILVKLASPYLQNKTIYLDEILSQPVINNQLCLSNSDITNNAEPYYLELFSSEGLNLDSVLIFPEYMQREVITISTVDLLTNFCSQCNELRHYNQFINSAVVKSIATQMDAIVVSKPNVVMLDIIKQQFQPTLLNLYQLDIEQHQDSVLNENKVSVISNDNGKAIEGVKYWRNMLKEQGSHVPLPEHFMPVYSGAKLQNFIPEGLHLDRIASLPLASYHVDASAAAVVDFYQSFYPDYERIKFGNFVVLVKGKQPFEGYSPEYMAIPHIVISEDPLGKGKTILQIIYRPDGREINGTRAMVFKPVT